MIHSKGEAHVTPKAIIVHNPAAFGAIDYLKTCADEKLLNDYYLFREHPNQDIFSEHHNFFMKTLQEAGMPTYTIADVLGDELSDFSEALSTNPNQVYTRDATVTLPWNPDVYLPCRMGRPIRNSEEKTMQKVLDKLGLTSICTLPENAVLEGGDVMPFFHENERILLIGYGRRTNREAIDFLAKTIMPEHVDRIIGVQLAEWRINLDGGMVVLSEDVIICHKASLLSAVSITPDGVDEDFDLFGFFETAGYEIIGVEQDESKRLQACNCVCLGNRTIVAYDLTPNVYEKMVEKGINVLRIPGTELVKGTGGPRCMTRPIYKEVTL